MLCGATMHLPEPIRMFQRPMYRMGSPTMVLDVVREIPEATSQDLREAFDHTAEYYLGLSGDEFLRRLDLNEISYEDPRVKKVLRRVNLVRPDWTRF